MVLAAARRRFDLQLAHQVAVSTATITSMIFVILFGASVFSIVFRTHGRRRSRTELLRSLPGGVAGAVLVVMGMMFLLGFILDTFEIIFIVIPITAPVLLDLGVSPIWLGVMVGVNLQTSFLDSAVWLLAVLPAGRRARHARHRPDLSRRHPVRGAANPRYGDHVPLPGARHVAAKHDLQLTQNTKPGRDRPGLQVSVASVVTLR